MGATRLAAVHASASPSTSGARSCQTAKCVLPKSSPFVSQRARFTSSKRAPLLVRAEVTGTPASRAAERSASARKPMVEGTAAKARSLTKDEKERLDANIGSVGLAREGPGGGGQWISTTTRHVHIFAGVVTNMDLDQSKLDKLTIDVDPDNEFVWNDPSLQKVFGKFEDLVAMHKGSPLTDYTLRLIGSDLEHFIRKLLQAGEIAYNLQHKAVNYSMGRPRMALENVPEEAYAKEE